jgi:hypothetical protein
MTDWRFLMRLITALGLLAMLLIAPRPTLAQSATPAVASPSAASGDFSGLVDIGGRKSTWSAAARAVRR